ncbi:MAG: hypothetical protein NTW29_07760 [Bacteroidetes bacterium]|nr:hypothetical protein [Bacteroidota bacterium]
MKRNLLLLSFFIQAAIFGQSAVFPRDWAGNWKGQLHWYKTGVDTAQKVTMKLRIHPTDSAGCYTWQLIYGAGGEDNRPYILIPKDSAGVHWAVDEKNGIVLDQYWVGNKLSGAFTVMNVTLFNTYWIENGKMMIEFYSIGSKPISTTGDGTDEIPKVDSYRLGSYQRAVLIRE